MSTIRVELQLNDGSFTSRMLHAGQSVKQLEAEVGKSITSIQSMERASSSFLRTLGAATLAIGAVSASIGLLRGTANSLVGDIVKVNAEFERMNQVMRGMSTAADPIKDAANQVKFLREYAAQTPFSLRSLTDVFIRMKSTGIDPMSGAMKGLVDATAAAGGTEQQLQRAALAISQMSGKGVIQMEELRQQLGEAIPRATELMARSMGVTYADLVQKISTGLVAAQPALQALSLEFERTFGGAAQQQMNTFNGLINQTKTHISNLALAAGDGGFMEAIKTQVRDLNEVMSGGAAKAMAREFGSGLASIVSGIRSTVDWVVRFRNELISTAEMIGYAFAGTLAIAGISRMMTGISALTANVVSLKQAFMGLTPAALAAAAAQRQAAAASGAAALGGTALSSAIGVLGFAVGRLLPVLGVVGVIASGVISFFDLFGSSAKRAEQSMTEFGATSQRELDKFKAETETRRAELAKREATYAYYEKIRSARGSNVGNHLFANPSNMSNLRSQIDAEKAELDKRDKLLGDRQKEFDVTEQERRTAALMRRVEVEEQAIRRGYDTQQREAAKNREANERAALSEHRSITVVRQEAQQRQRDESLKFYDDLASHWEKAMGDADRRLADARANNDKKGVDQALADQAAISQRLADIRARQDAQRAQALGVQIAPKIVDDAKLVEKGQSQLSKLKADIESFKAELAGASGESAKLAFQLEKVKFKDAGDNAVVKELINDIKTAQSEYEKLEDLINGQKKLSQDIATIIRRAREQRFEFENPGATDADKLKARVKAGDYKGLTLDDNGQIVRTKEAAETLAKLYADPDVQAGIKGLNSRINEQKTGIDAARDAGIQANNAFVSGFQRSRSSVEAFNETLGRTLNLFDQMRSGVPNLASGGFSGLAGGGVVGGSWTSGGDFGRFIDRLTGVESGGNASARNGNSSATGLGQFISGTWMSFIKETMPELLKTHSQAQILAMRNDAGMSRQATEWYARKNAGVLEMNGFSPTDANLYLAHFLGSAGATKLLRSDPNTAIRDVVGDDAYRANLNKNGRFVYGETAGEVLSTIQRKFGNALSIKGQAASEPTPQSIISGASGAPVTQDQVKATRDYAAAEREAAAATAENEKARANFNKVIESGVKLTDGSGKDVNAGIVEAQVEEEKTAAAKANDYIRQRQLALKNGEESLKQYGDEVAKFREKVRAGEFGKNIDPDSEQYRDQLQKLKEIDEANKKVEESTKRKTAAERALEQAAKAAREAERRNADTAKRNANPLGRDPSEDQSASLRRQSEERLHALELQHGKESQIYKDAQAEETRIMEAGANERASKRNMELAREVQDGERSVMTATQSARAKADAEIKALQDELAASQATGETRIKQEEYIAKRIAQLRQQASANGPMAQASRQWADLGKNMETAMVGWIDGGIDAIADFVATGEMNFKKLAQSILKDLTKMGLRYMMSGVMGNKGTGAAGKAGKAATGGKSFGAHHTGGLVGSPSMFRHGINPAVFSGAAKFHTGGIIGGLSALSGLQPGEVPIIAKQGEGVFTPEQMKAMGGSNVGVSQTVNVNVTGGSSGNAKQDQALADNIAKRVQGELRAMVGSEIKQQLRPNGMIREATR